MVQQPDVVGLDSSILRPCVTFASGNGQEQQTPYLGEGKMVDPRGLEFREAGSIPAALTKF